MVTLYSTDCPRCKILKEALQKNQVPFKIGDIAEVMEAGYRSVPMLKLDTGHWLDYIESMQYAKNGGIMWLDTK